MYENLEKYAILSDHQFLQREKVYLFCILSKMVWVHDSIYFDLSQTQTDSVHYHLSFIKVHTLQFSPDAAHQQSQIECQ